jgi:hypothetical protein
MKSAGITLSPVELSMLTTLQGVYNANRSEIIRAAVRAAYADYVQSCADQGSAPNQMSLFEEAP